MKRHVALAALIASCSLGVSHALAAGGDIDSVKALYANASYEEALATLDSIENGDAIQMNQYRALCLLALGRTHDAEAPLQQIVMINPLYSVPTADVSPRLVDLFREVRKRALPTAVRQLYAKAKSSFDTKHPADAAADFKALLTVLADPDAAERKAEIGDLKDLAQGFLTLAEAQIAAATPAPPPVPAAAPPPAPALVEAKIYSAADSDVRPPIEVQRLMPPWRPARGAMERMVEHRGIVKLIIDEQGHVESAAIVTSIFPSYNDDVLQAAKSWRYQPATRQGKPVKYALTLEIVLRAASAQDDHEG